MAKLKIKKEQPRYKVQTEYENQLKMDYGKMLNTMNKEIIHRLTQNVGDAKE